MLFKMKVITRSWQLISTEIYRAIIYIFSTCNTSIKRDHLIVDKNFIGGLEE